MNRLAILTIAVFYYACSSVDVGEDRQPIRIDLQSIKDTTIVIEEFAKVVDVLPLVTDDSLSMIAAISDVAVSDSFFLVLDFTPVPAKLFDRTGQFIRPIGQVGEGPGEYLTLVSPTIDEQKEEISVTLGGNYTHPEEGAMYSFDIEGNFMRKIQAAKLDSTRMNSNDQLLHQGWLYLPGNPEDNYSVRRYNITSGKIEQLNSLLSPDYFTYRSNISKIARYGQDSLLLYQGESDTIYSISFDSKTQEPAFILDFGRHRFDSEKIDDARKSSSNRFEKIMKATEGGYSPQLLGVFNNYLLFDLFIGGEKPQTEYLLVSMKSGQAYFVQFLSESLADLPLEGNLICHNSSYLVFTLKAFDIQDHLNAKYDQEKSAYKGITEMEEDDNVLIIADFVAK